MTFVRLCFDHPIFTFIILYLLGEYASDIAGKLRRKTVINNYSETPVTPIKTRVQDHTNTQQ